MDDNDILWTGAKNELNEMVFSSSKERDSFIKSFTAYVKEYYEWYISDDGPPMSPKNWYHEGWKEWRGPR